jgi:hypothetical protein
MSSKETWSGRLLRGSLLAVLVAGGGGCTVTDPSHPVVKSYLAAEVLTPTWSHSIRPSEPAWSHILDVGSGVTATVTAACCVGGRFRAQYSDEKEPRIIGIPGDYLYPRELRLDRIALRVYGMASGLAGGIYLKTVIFEFDLARRKAVAEVDVDLKILPAVREPEGPKPRN